MKFSQNHCEIRVILNSSTIIQFSLYTPESHPCRLSVSTHKNRASFNQTA